MASRTSILIVEDELLPAEYLKEILEKEGYIVLDIVVKGKEAIEKIEALKPDIVLLDIMLKDSINGCQVALAVGRLPCSPRIIFLTAYKDKYIFECDEILTTFPCISKPYKEREIIEMIEKSLQNDESSLN